MKVRKMFMYQSPADTSGAGGNTTLEQALQQLEESQRRYQVLQAKIDSGKLVEPDPFLKAQIDQGLVFPKERYVGLQKTLQTEQDKAITATEALASLQGASAELKASFSTLETQAAELKRTNDEKEAKVKELTMKTERAKLIMGKYPELAIFEASELLPVGDVEKLDEIFGNFSKKLASTKLEATRERLTGGGETTPGGKDTTEVAPVGPKAILKEAHVALASNDQDLYNTKMDDYYKALEAQQT